MKSSGEDCHDLALQDRIQLHAAQALLHAFPSLTKTQHDRWRFVGGRYNHGRFYLLVDGPNEVVRRRLPNTATVLRMRQHPCAPTLS